MEENGFKFTIPCGLVGSGCPRVKLDDVVGRRRIIIMLLDSGASGVINLASLIRGEIPASTPHRFFGRPKKEQEATICGRRSGAV